MEGAVITLLYLVTTCTAFSDFAYDIANENRSDSGEDYNVQTPRASIVQENQYDMDSINKYFQKLRTTGVCDESSISKGLNKCLAENSAWRQDCQVFHQLFNCLDIQADFSDCNFEVYESLPSWKSVGNEFKASKSSCMENCESSSVSRQYSICKQGLDESGNGSDCTQFNKYIKCVQKSLEADECQGKNFVFTASGRQHRKVLKSHKKCQSIFRSTFKQGKGEECTESLFDELLDKCEFKKVADELEVISKKQKCNSVALYSECTKLLLTSSCTDSSKYSVYKRYHQHQSMVDMTQSTCSSEEKNKCDEPFLLKELAKCKIPDITSGKCEIVMVYQECVLNAQTLAACSRADVEVISNRHGLVLNKIDDSCVPTRSTQEEIKGCFSDQGIAKQEECSTLYKVVNKGITEGNAAQGCGHLSEFQKCVDSLRQDFACQDDEIRNTFKVLYADGPSMCNITDCEAKALFTRYNGCVKDVTCEHYQVATDCISDAVAKYCRIENFQTSSLYQTYSVFSDDLTVKCNLDACTFKMTVEGVKSCRQKYLQKIRDLKNQNKKEEACKLLQEYIKCVNHTLQTTKCDYKLFPTSDEGKGYIAEINELSDVCVIDPCYTNEIENAMKDCLKLAEAIETGIKSQNPYEACQQFQLFKKCGLDSLARHKCDSQKGSKAPGIMEFLGLLDKYKDICNIDPCDNPLITNAVKICDDIIKGKDITSDEEACKILDDYGDCIKSRIACLNCTLEQFKTTKNGQHFLKEYENLKKKCEVPPCQTTRLKNFIEECNAKHYKELQSKDSLDALIAFCRGYDSWLSCIHNAINFLDCKPEDFKNTPLGKDYESKRKYDDFCDKKCSFETIKSKFQLCGLYLDKIPSTIPPEKKLEYCLLYDRHQECIKDVFNCKSERFENTKEAKEREAKVNSIAEQCRDRDPCADENFLRVYDFCKGNLSKIDSLEEKLEKCRILETFKGCVNSLTTGTQCTAELFKKSKMGQDYENTLDKYKNVCTLETCSGKYFDQAFTNCLKNLKDIGSKPQREVCIAYKQYRSCIDSLLYTRKCPPDEFVKTEQGAKHNDIVKKYDEYCREDPCRNEDIDNLFKLCLEKLAKIDDLIREKKMKEACVTYKIYSNCVNVALDSVKCPKEKFLETGNGGKHRDNDNKYRTVCKVDPCNNEDLNELLNTCSYRLRNITLFKEKEACSHLDKYKECVAAALETHKCKIELFKDTEKGKEYAEKINTYQNVCNINPCENRNLINALEKCKPYLAEAEKKRSESGSDNEEPCKFFGSYKQCVQDALRFQGCQEEIFLNTNLGKDYKKVLDEFSKYCVVDPCNNNRILKQYYECEEQLKELDKILASKPKELGCDLYKQFLTCVEITLKAHKCPKLDFGRTKAGERYNQKVNLYKHVCELDKCNNMDLNNRYKLCKETYLTKSKGKGTKEDRCEVYKEFQTCVQNLLNYGKCSESEFLKTDNGKDYSQIREANKDICVLDPCRNVKIENDFEKCVRLLKSLESKGGAEPSEENCKVFLNYKSCVEKMLFLSNCPPVEFANTPNGKKHDSYVNSLQQVCNINPCKSVDFLSKYRECRRKIPTEESSAPNKTQYCEHYKGYKSCVEELLVFEKCPMNEFIKTPKGEEYTKFMYNLDKYCKRDPCQNGELDANYKKCKQHYLKNSVDSEDKCKEYEAFVRCVKYLLDTENCPLNVFLTKDLGPDFKPYLDFLDKECKLNPCKLKAFKKGFVQCEQKLKEIKENMDEEDACKKYKYYKGCVDTLLSVFNCPGNNFEETDQGKKHKENVEKYSGYCKEFPCTSKRIKDRIKACYRIADQMKNEKDIERVCELYKGFEQCVLYLLEFHKCPMQKFLETEKGKQYQEFLNNNKKVCDIDNCLKKGVAEAYTICEKKYEDSLAQCGTQGSKCTRQDRCNIFKAFQNCVEDMLKFKKCLKEPFLNTPSGKKYQQNIRKDEKICDINKCDDETINNGYKVCETYGKKMVGLFEKSHNRRGCRVYREYISCVLGLLGMSECSESEFVKTKNGKEYANLRDCYKELCTRNPCDNPEINESLRKCEENIKNIQSVPRSLGCRTISDYKICVLKVLQEAACFEKDFNSTSNGKQYYDNLAKHMKLCDDDPCNVENLQKIPKIADIHKEKLKLAENDKDYELACRYLTQYKLAVESVLASFSCPLNQFIQTEMGRAYDSFVKSKEHFCNEISCDNKKFVEAFQFCKKILDGLDKYIDEGDDVESCSIYKNYKNCVNNLRMLKKCKDFDNSAVGREHAQLLEKYKRACYLDPCTTKTFREKIAYCHSEAQNINSYNNRQGRLTGCKMLNDYYNCVKNVLNILKCKNETFIRTPAGKDYLAFLQKYSHLCKDNCDNPQIRKAFDDCKKQLGPADNLLKDRDYSQVCKLYQAYRSCIESLLKLTGCPPDEFHESKLGKEDAIIRIKYEPSCTANPCESKNMIDQFKRCEDHISKLEAATQARKYREKCHLYNEYLNCVKYALDFAKCSVKDFNETRLGMVHLAYVNKYNRSCEHPCTTETAIEGLKMCETQLQNIQALIAEGRIEDACHAYKSAGFCISSLLKAVDCKESEFLETDMGKRISQLQKQYSYICYTDPCKSSKVRNAYSECAKDFQVIDSVIQDDPVKACKDLERFKACVNNIFRFFGCAKENFTKLKEGKDYEEKIKKYEYVCNINPCDTKAYQKLYDKCEEHARDIGPKIADKKFKDACRILNKYKQCVSFLNTIMKCEVSYFDQTNNGKRYKDMLKNYDPICSKGPCESPAVRENYLSCKKHLNNIPKITEDDRKGCVNVHLFDACVKSALLFEGCLLKEFLTTENGKDYQNELAKYPLCNITCDKDRMKQSVKRCAETLNGVAIAIAKNNLKEACRLFQTYLECVKAAIKEAGCFDSDFYSTDERVFHEAAINKYNWVCSKGNCGNPAIEEKYNMCKAKLGQIEKERLVETKQFERACIIFNEYKGCVATMLLFFDCLEKDFENLPQGQLHKNLLERYKSVCDEKCEAQSLKDKLAICYREIPQLKSLAESKKKEDACLIYSKFLTCVDAMLAIQQCDPKKFETTEDGQKVKEIKEKYSWVCVVDPCDNKVFNLKLMHCRNKLSILTLLEQKVEVCKNFSTYRTCVQQTLAEEKCPDDKFQKTHFGKRHKNILKKYNKFCNDSCRSVDMDIKAAQCQDKIRSIPEELRNQRYVRACEIYNDYLLCMENLLKLLKCDEKDFFNTFPGKIYQVTKDMYKWVCLKDEPCLDNSIQNQYRKCRLIILKLAGGTPRRFKERCQIFKDYVKCVETLQEVTSCKREDFGKTPAGEEHKQILENNKDTCEDPCQKPDFIDKVKKCEAIVAEIERHEQSGDFEQACKEYNKYKNCMSLVLSSCECKEEEFKETKYWQKHLEILDKFKDICNRDPCGSKKMQEKYKECKEQYLNILENFIKSKEKEKACQTLNSFKGCVNAAKSFVRCIHFENTADGKDYQNILNTYSWVCDEPPCGNRIWKEEIKKCRDIYDRVASGIKGPLENYDELCKAIEDYINCVDNINSKVGCHLEEFLRMSEGKFHQSVLDAKAKYCNKDSCAFPGIKPKYDRLCKDQVKELFQASKNPYGVWCDAHKKWNKCWQELLKDHNCTDYSAPPIAKDIEDINLEHKIACTLGPCYDLKFAKRVTDCSMKSGPIDRLLDAQEYGEGCKLAGQYEECIRKAKKDDNCTDEEYEKTPLCKEYKLRVERWRLTCKNVTACNDREFQKNIARTCGISLNRAIKDFEGNNNDEGCDNYKQYLICIKKRLGNCKMEDFKKTEQGKKYLDAIAKYGPKCGIETCNTSPLGLEVSKLENDLIKSISSVSRDQGCKNVATYMYSMLAKVCQIQCTRETFFSTNMGKGVKTNVDNNAGLCSGGCDYRYLYPVLQHCVNILGDSKSNCTLLPKYTDCVDQGLKDIGCTRDQVIEMAMANEYKGRYREAEKCTRQFRRAPMSNSEFEESADYSRSPNEGEAEEASIADKNKRTKRAKGLRRKRSSSLSYLKVRNELDCHFFNFLLFDNK